MENVIGRFMEHIAKAIEKNKKNENKNSLEYRLGMNEAYSEVLTIVTKAMIDDHQAIKERNSDGN